MPTSRVEHPCRTKRTFGLVAALVFSTALHTVSATTYISVEPIPNRDVVGEADLTLIRSIGYERLARWSELLLSECGAVDSVIEALTAHGAITSVMPDVNTRFVVAAGGFEGATNPSYVFTVEDSGPNGVTMHDVDVLDNALGFILSQGATVHFSPDNAKAYDFVLDYAVVTFQYLANIGGTPELVAELRLLQEKHLAAVDNLLAAIGSPGGVDAYLDGFSCPD
jgi:hypothetical protein